MTYGYRRMSYALLRDEGIVMNHKKVSRIMKKYRLIVKHTQLSNGSMARRQRQEGAIVENHLKRQFNFPKPNQAWVTDITYLIFGNQRRYLSTILDLHTRKIVSYRIGCLNSNELVYNTLHDALSKEKEVHGCILHSDQGYQYTSTHYQVICRSHGIITSMSRKGNPLDNAVIESFHSLLKKETLYNNQFTSIDDYVQSVIHWLDFYNSDRIQLSQTKSRHLFI
jgi:transposase InsO family protein